MSDVPSGIRNLIVISDPHFGCKLGLCPPEGIELDEGNVALPSRLQLQVWAMWKYFWDNWVPRATRGEEYAVALNGDAIDGDHHRSSTPFTTNIKDQRRLAQKVLAPLVNSEKCKAYFHIRGTEAHVGISGQDEEALAASLGAIPDEHGNHARWEMWLRMRDRLIHLTHHIGTTSSAAYESTAVLKELIEAYNEAGRWGDKPPDVVVRSHRHRAMHITLPTEGGYGISIVTPGWQLKTPFVYRQAQGRSGTPQIGGYLIRCGDEDHIYARFKIWKVSRPREVAI